MQQTVLRSSQDQLILIEHQVIQVIDSFRQLKTLDKEAGGIMIGEYRDKHLRVTGLTRPGVLDHRYRNGFHRKSPHHQAYATMCWIQSKSLQVWLGEWHSHPEDHPTPSSIDLDNWKSKLPNRHMILIIQGRISRWWGLWDGKSITALEVIG